MYRPQFVYGPPGNGCNAMRCSYSFDGTNCPSLASIPAGQPLTKIPLAMDQDSAFVLRAIEIPNAGVQVRLEDAFENPLLTDGLYIDPELWAASNGAGVVPLESDEWGIYCPAGSMLLLYVSNPGGSPVGNFVINLHGEKWFPEGDCS